MVNCLTGFTPAAIQAFELVAGNHLAFLLSARLLLEDMFKTYVSER